MYNRFPDFKQLSTKKSFFLFGPRSTGKSTLLKKIFGESNSQILFRNIGRYIPWFHAGTLARIKEATGHSNWEILFFRYWSGQLLKWHQSYQ